MGTYREIDGDLIELTKEGHFDLIAHGANCFRTMTAGIALQIVNNFPNVELVDKYDTRLPTQRLGDLTIGFHYINDGFRYKEINIVNLYTQFQSGKNLDYDALRLCLRKLNYLFPNQKLGLPYVIGCGIAGGDKEKVLSIIKEELKGMNVTMVKYKK